MTTLGDPFEVEVVQAFPAGASRELAPGRVVRVRVSADRTAAAVDQ